MVNKKGIAYSLIFLCSLILFIIFKWSHLYLPYIFDELHFYGPALLKMYQNGPSLSPEAIPVFYSRGHPLFFHFIGATWLSIFGSSILSSHLFALTISILLLLCIFYFIAKAFSFEAALTAILIILVQPIFLAQSNLVLPEITLALLMVTSLLAYLENNKIIYWIAASLAMMTKESALVIFGALPIFIIVESIFIEKKPLKKIIRELLFVLSPITLWILFLIWQKLTLGWFFFPEHTGIMDLTPSTVYKKFTNILLIVYIWSGRNSITFTIIGIIIWNFYKKNSTKKEFHYLLLFSIFSILFISFSSINFFTNRYIISLVLLLAILGAIFIHSVSIKKTISWVIIAIILVVGIVNINTLRYNCDHNLGYVDALIEKNNDD